LEFVPSGQVVFDHVAPEIVVDETVAPERFAPVKLSFAIFAEVRFAPIRLAFVKVLPERLALVKFAPSTLADVQLMLGKVNPERSSPERFTLGPTMNAPNHARASGTPYHVQSGKQYSAWWVLPTRAYPDGRVTPVFGAE
jgi:hypothetical protein